MKTLLVSAMAVLAFGQPALAQTSSGEVVTKARVDPSSITKLLIFPAGSLGLGEQGEVSVSVCVSAHGRASKVTITKSSGNDRLDQTTVDMLSQARYTPAKDASGKSVAMCDPPYTLTWVWRPPER
jgi:TonB family protein